MVTTLVVTVTWGTKVVDVAGGSPMAVATLMVTVAWGTKVANVACGSLKVTVVTAAPVASNAHGAA